MTNTITATRDQANTIETTQRKEASKAEICFGAVMGIVAIAGMWGAVSLLINYFV